MSLTLNQLTVLALLAESAPATGLTKLEIGEGLKRKLTAVQVHDVVESLIDDDLASFTSAPASPGMQLTVLKHHITDDGRDRLIAEQRKAGGVRP